VGRTFAPTTDLSDEGTSLRVPFLLSTEGGLSSRGGKKSLEKKRKSLFRKTHNPRVGGGQKRRNKLDELKWCRKSPPTVFFMKKAKETISLRKLTWALSFLRNLKGAFEGAKT